MSACGTTERLPSVPLAAITSGKAQFLGLSNARFVVGEDDALIRAEWIGTERRHIRREGGGDYHILALSGGGENGAYGAGLLYGWTERGDRPQFEMVTGISTGALIAPFAFLGARYDEELKRFYTTIGASDIAAPRPIVTALLSDAFADTAPLAALIENALTDDMVREIGAEYRKGRFLIIGTTNLDIGRPVIWNVGAIAASGHPEAAQAVRRILLASASIPVAFPPVLFELDLDGQKRAELHVDGGAAAQLYLYPADLTVRAAPPDLRARRRFAWLIRNGRFVPDPQETPRRLTSIAARSVTSMIDANSLGDIYRAYVITRRDKVAFNLAYIRPTFTLTSEKPFDTAFMGALFEHGRAEMRAARSWTASPPGFAQ